MCSVMAVFCPLYAAIVTVGDPRFAYVRTARSPRGRGRGCACRRCSPVARDSRSRRRSRSRPRRRERGRDDGLAWLARLLRAERPARHLAVANEHAHVLAPGAADRVREHAQAQVAIRALGHRQAQGRDLAVRPGAPRLGRRPSASQRALSVLWPRIWPAIAPGFAAVSVRRSKEKRRRSSGKLRGCSSGATAGSANSTRSAPRAAATTSAGMRIARHASPGSRVRTSGCSGVPFALTCTVSGLAPWGIARAASLSSASPDSPGGTGSSSSARSAHVRTEFQSGGVHPHSSRWRPDPITPMEISSGQLQAGSHAAGAFAAPGTYT